MKFYENIENCDWCKQRGLSIERATDIEYASLQHCVNYGFEEEGRLVRTREASQSLLKTIGEWDEILVWITQWEVWPSSEDWPDYYNWRGQRNEKRSLWKAPGHLFGKSEQSDLSELLIKIMDNGWDAHVLICHGQSIDDIRAFVSHDGFFDVFSKQPLTLRK